MFSSTAVSDAAPVSAPDTVLPSQTLHTDIPKTISAVVPAEKKVQTQKKTPSLKRKEKAVPFYDLSRLSFIKKYPDGQSLYNNILSIATAAQKIKISASDISVQGNDDAVKGIINSLIQGDINTAQAKIHIDSSINKLRNRISINKSYGNSLAVRRDKTKIEYYKVLSEMFSFFDSMGNIANKRFNDGIYGDKKITELRNSEDIILSTKPVTGKGAVSDAVNKNVHDLYSATYIFRNLLEYLKLHHDIVAPVNWASYISLNKAISIINDNRISKSINRTISRINLDVGGLVMFVFLFVVVTLIYPVVFRITHNCISKYVLKDNSEDYEDSKKFAYVELRRPIKILVVFFGLDMSTQALLHKTNLIGYISESAFVVHTFILSWIFLKIINLIVSIQIEKFKQKEFVMRKELFNLVVHIVKAITFVVASIIILTHFGISISAILSTLGIGGLAFALAAKDTLSNLFGGVSLMVDDVFSLNDWVKIGDSEGTVASIGLRSTTIRTFDNALITIPNSQVSTVDVMNWNRRMVGRRIKMWVGVTYESDMGNIRQSIEDIRTMLREHSGIANPKNTKKLSKRATRFYDDANVEGIKNTQLVFLDRYNEYSIDILIYCFSKTVKWDDWLAVKEDVLYKIAEILKNNNVEFAYPTEIMINKVSD